MKIQLLATLLFMLVPLNDARVLMRCELIGRLKIAGVDGFYGYSLGDWICMAYHESRYNSRTVGPHRSDGSRNYGIFQLNSRWWCSNRMGKTANACHIPCSSLVDDNISNDIACAKRVICDPKGMGAWKAWTKNCKGRNLSRWTAGCKL